MWLSVLFLFSRSLGVDTKMASALVQLEVAISSSFSLESGVLCLGYLRVQVELSM